MNGKTTKMSETDITELERRLSAALDRIGQAGAALAAAPRPDNAPDDTAAQEALAQLEEALEAERSANAQLEERVRAIREKLDTKVAQLEQQLAEAQTRAKAAETDTARLRQAAEELRRNNDALRAANAEGLADPQLINRAMEAELATLRALRDSDRDEVNAVLDALAPFAPEETHHA